MRYERFHNGFNLKLGKRLALHVFRRHRSRAGYEYHNHGGTRFVNVWWGHPNRHAAWAASVYLYF